MSQTARRMPVPATEIDPGRETLLNGLFRTFPTICHQSLRFGETFERQGKIGSGDYSCMAAVTDEAGQLLVSISVSGETYEKMIRGVFPASAGKGINEQTRDLLMSIMKAALCDAFGKKHGVSPTLVEGPGHSLFLSQSMTSTVVVCECSSGTMYVQFARSGHASR